jgi:3-deoxy-manno-octulosonate cytidylyltransferase (CMP-KDO synthetase)
MRKAIGLIPSRLNSRRLPRKSLRMIGNLPLIIHTYRRVKLSKKIDEAFICCDSKEVIKIAKKYNANAILTSKKHKCGTDRIYEAFRKLGNKYDQIINIQGDEPLIDPKNVDKVIDYHRKNKNSDIILPNLPSRYTTDPNLIKLIFNKEKKVMFMTRSDTPYQFKKKIKKFYKHLSVISFTPHALRTYASSRQGKLELIEDVELLRALDIGLEIKTFSLKGNSVSVDVAKNLIEVRKKMVKNKYYKIYSKY